MIDDKEIYTDKEMYLSAKESRKGKDAILWIFLVFTIASLVLCFIALAGWGKAKSDLNKYTKAEAIEPEYDMKIIPKDGETLIVKYGANYECEYAYFIGNVVVFKLADYDTIYYASTSQVVISIQKTPNV